MNMLERRWNFSFKMSKLSNNGKFLAAEKWFFLIPNVDFKYSGYKTYMQSIPLYRKFGWQSGQNFQPCVSCIPRPARPHGAKLLFVLEALCSTGRNLSTYVKLLWFLLSPTSFVRKEVGFCPDYSLWCSCGNPLSWRWK